MTQTNTSHPPPLEVAVVGVGRMGRHHARIWKSIPGARLAAVVDANAKLADDVAKTHGCRAHTTVEELLQHHPTIQAVSVAVPTIAHLAAALPLLEKGIACLVEKPLAPDVSQAQQLVRAAQAHQAVLQVGHTERFNPVVRALVNMHLTPRFLEVHRISPMTFRSLDVGVVMDMMIHDLDIVLSLVQSPLLKIEAVGVSVLGKHEDVANARLTFAGGCVANITASRLALKTERRMRLFSESAYVSLDYQNRSGIVITQRGNAAALSEIRQKIAAGEDLSSLDYSKLVNIQPLTMNLPAEQLDPLTAELSSFLEAVRLGKKPVVDGSAGSSAVEAAQRILQAIGEHRWQNLNTSSLAFPPV